MTTLYIFRHGETDWNKEGRFQGHSDVALNPTGHAQAEIISTSLVRFKLDAILSSDLERALQTAKPTADQLNIPIFRTPHLREAHLGQAEGLLMGEIYSRFGYALAEQWRSYDHRFLDESYPNGESGRKVIDRVFPAIESFLLNNTYERIGISTHGGVIRRMFQKFLMDRVPGHASEPVPIPNGVIYIAHFDRKSQLWSIPPTFPLYSDT